MLRIPFLNFQLLFTAPVSLLRVNPVLPIAHALCFTSRPLLENKRNMDPQNPKHRALTPPPKVRQTTAVGYDQSRHTCSCSGEIDGLVYNAVKFGCNNSSENGVWACCQMVSKVTGKSQICKKNASIKQGTRQREGVGATGAHN